MSRSPSTALRKRHGNLEGYSQIELFKDESNVGLMPKALSKPPISVKNEGSSLFKGEAVLSLTPYPRIF